MCRLHFAPLKLCVVKRRKNSTHILKLTNWQITVASAEPRTPQPSTRMNTASRAMLIEMGITQMSRPYSILPSARMIDEKPVENTLPASRIVKYCFA